MRSVDGANSIVADPRTPNHRRLVKSVNFLLEHPDEAEIRAVEGLPTHQPLARLLPRLLATNGISGAFVDGTRDNTPRVDFPSPKFMRVHADETLVESLRKTLAEPEVDTRVWDRYWNAESRRIESNRVHYGGTAPKTAAGKVSDGSSQIVDSRTALEAFQSLDLIVGFHPDQATEATVDLALLLGVPFAVVPW